MRIVFPQNDLAIKNMKRIKSANKAGGKPQNQNYILDRRNKVNFNSTYRGDTAQEVRPRYIDNKAFENKNDNSIERTSPRIKYNSIQRKNTRQASRSAIMSSTRQGMRNNNYLSTN